MFDFSNEWIARTRTSAHPTLQCAGARADKIFVVSRRQRNLCTSSTDNAVDNDVRANLSTRIGNGIAQSTQEDDDDRIRAFLSGKHILITGGTGTPILHLHHFRSSGA